MEGLTSPLFWLKGGMLSSPGAATSAFAFGQGIVEGDATGLGISHDAIGRLPIVHHMAVITGIADAELSSGDEVGGESGGGSEHAHDL